MQVTDILSQTGGLQSIATELGHQREPGGERGGSPGSGHPGRIQETGAGPPDGLEGLGGLLNQLGGGGLLDDVLASRPTDVGRGNEVLGQIFGSKDVSRAVAQNAASQSGLDPSVLKKMLPMLAMLVAGYMAKQQTAGAGAQAASG